MPKRTDRDTELSGRAKIKERLLDLYQAIDKAFADAGDRINDQMDFWDIYNCDIGDKQFYQGNAEIYLPIVRDAIDARVTRFTNQVFPGSGRYVEVVTTDTDLPFHYMALLEHYVDTARLRDLVVPALLRNGDVEGQWNLYVSWNDTKRHVTYKSQHGPMLDGVQLEADEAEPIEDVVNEVLEESSPHVEVIPDSDVMVLPALADSIPEALAVGGSVTILRRWSKAKIKDMAAKGEITQSAADDLVDALDGKKGQRIDAKKAHVDSAGINSAGKYALVYETWTMLEVDKTQRLCRAYYGAADIILGCKLNPYWCDLCPLISAPLKKVSGSFKGISQVKPVAAVQYSANDFMNQGADSATYGLLPIIMTDPIKNPRVGSMVLDLAAVWEVDPNSTKFAEFPQLWKDALELVSAARAQIFQSLGVNSAMIPGTTKQAKQNQADVAREQQVDILTTADVVTSLEAGILTPLVQRFAWYDAQFRDKEITVRAYGREGLQAQMEVVPPFQMNTRFWFKWLGVEQARSIQQMQTQMSTINVLRGIPPQQYPGYRVNLVPAIERMMEASFGSRLAPKIFESMKDQLSMPADQENPLLAQGFELPVSPFDDDQKHIREHYQLMQLGDPTGQIRVHIQKHTMQLQMRLQAQAQAMIGGQPGVPGGAGPGVAGTPRQGANVGQPRAQMVPGTIHADQLPLAPPRKM